MCINNLHGILAHLNWVTDLKIMFTTLTFLYPWTDRCITCTYLDLSHFKAIN